MNFKQLKQKLKVQNLEGYECGKKVFGRIYMHRAIAEKLDLIPDALSEYAKEKDPEGLYDIFVMPAGTRDRYNSDYRDGYRLLLSPDFMTANEPVVIASISMQSTAKCFRERRYNPFAHDWEFKQKLYTIKQQRVIHHKWALFPQEMAVEVWNNAVKRSKEILKIPYKNSNCGYKHIWQKWCIENGL